MGRCGFEGGSAPRSPRQNGQRPAQPSVYSAWLGFSRGERTRQRRRESNPHSCFRARASADILFLSSIHTRLQSKTRNLRALNFTAGGIRSEPAQHSQGWTDLPLPGSSGIARLPRLPGTTSTSQRHTLPPDSGSLLSTRRATSLWGSQRHSRRRPKWFNNSCMISNLQREDRCIVQPDSFAWRWIDHTYFQC